jgi:alpha-D-xyloside xylohydrolase
MTLSSLLLVFLLCTVGVVNSASTPQTKIGNGYRLISIEESPDGGLVGHLLVNQNNKIYGPDIAHLQLFVKYVQQAKLHYVHVMKMQPFDIFLFCFDFVICAGMRRRTA